MARKIGVIGAGAWGSALAQCFAGGGHKVLLWAREAEVVEAVNTVRENTLFLPGVKLGQTIEATGDLNRAAAESEILVLVPPAQHVRTVLKPMKDHVGGAKPVVLCAKGFEIDSGLLLSEVAREIVPGINIAVMTGPSFAREIAMGLPSALTLAAADQKTGAALIQTLGSRALRLYYSDDVRGAQIGGAVKNVIAIACGIVTGLRLGDSARAALVTRGMAEMARLAAAMGAKRETLMGMCGMGDLILTCTSMQSRNYSLGAFLGEGRPLEDILRERNAVTEGIHTARALKVVAARNGIDMPISEAVHACLSEGLPVHEAIERMLDRPTRAEGA